MGDTTEANGTAEKPGKGPSLSCDPLVRRIGELRRAVQTLEELEAAGVAGTGVEYARQALARLEQQVAPPLEAGTPALPPAAAVVEG